jgi:hypothetical protein
MAARVAVSAALRVASVPTLECERHDFSSGGGVNTQGSKARPHCEQTSRSPSSFQSAPHGQAVGTWTLMGV